MLYYQIHIKEENPKILNETDYLIVKKQISEKKYYIEISGELYDRFLIIKIKKLIRFEDFLNLTNKETVTTKRKIKEYIKMYEREQKEITKKVLQNMLEIAKS
jgi:hypothetical protein